MPLGLSFGLSPYSQSLPFAQQVVPPSGPSPILLPVSTQPPTLSERPAIHLPSHHIGTPHIYNPHLSTSYPQTIAKFPNGTIIKYNYHATFPEHLVKHPGTYSSITSLPFLSNVLENNKRKGRPHLLTDLHDTGHSSVHFLHDDDRLRKACLYVRCRELVFYCPIKERSLLTAGKERQSSGSLPFTCGLYEVCCENKDLSTHKVTSPLHSTDDDCGLSLGDRINARMGHPTLEKGRTRFAEFPWQGAILKKDGQENIYICAATLIDNSHVLTAAHCVDGYAVAELRVRLGEWDVNRETEFYPHLEHDVVGIATHPDYSPGNLHNDIALVRLLYPVNYSKSPHISPICLPRRGRNSYNHRCYVTGWGKNAFGENGRYQNLLQKVDVPLVSRSRCESSLHRTRLGPDFTLHPGMMCAGGEPEKDACKGDGGGPLSCIGEDGRYYATGIVSWGIGCGQPGIPGIYSRVEYYSDWIQDTIKM